MNILTLTTFQAGVIGLGLNYGAYMTEIFRAGIQSVGHGQAEAADALGMTYAQRMRRVVLPQAARVIIPPTGNEFIAMMKDTALVASSGVDVRQAELFRRAQLGREPGPASASSRSSWRPRCTGLLTVDLHVLPEAAGAPDLEGLRPRRARQTGTGGSGPVHPGGGRRGGSRWSASDVDGSPASTVADGGAAGRAR